VRDIANAKETATDRIGLLLPLKEITKDKTANRYNRSTQRLHVGKIKWLCFMSGATKQL
jgi:hypothetical protein